MGTGIFFPIAALPIIVIILLTFNLKKHIKSDETKLFNMLCIANFFGLIIEIACSWACKNYVSYYFLSQFILKSYLIYLLIWTAFFTMYIFRISNIQVKQIYRYIHIFLLGVAFVFVYFLPIRVITFNNYQVHYN